MKPEAFEMILDSIADGVFTVSPEWRITSWNKAAERITGFSAEEAIGSFCHDVFRANVCQGGCVLRQTMETGENLLNRPINILTREGYEKPVSISTAVLLDEEGQPAGGVETFRDLTEIEHLRRRLERDYSFEDIVSKNSRIRELFEIMPRVAESESTVLIQGESGSGKELFARALHNLSARKGKPFVGVSCAALPGELLESELFGYQAGAFTGARTDKPGRFAAAAGGTLFLDEIGEIPQALQVKLLRVLQERVYEPLGANVPVPAEVRIVAATNRDLKAEVDGGRFRGDLYYRLNVVRLELPPLRRRREDIPLLAGHFIARFNAEKGREIEGLTPAALSALSAHDYPGNVRELENAIEHAFVMCRGAWIDVQHLPPEIVGDETSGQPSAPAPTDDTAFDAAEAAVIRAALAQHDGHRVRTARSLGIHKTTLLRKMKKLGVTWKRGRM